MVKRLPTRTIAAAPGSTTKIILLSNIAAVTRNFSGTNIRRMNTPISDEAKKLGGHWVIAVYDEKGGKNVAIYSSINLKDWKEESHLNGYFECAELFELPVDGNKKKTKWAVFAADAKYAIGDFDGKTFTPEHEGKHQVHWGPYYASQCFSGDPKGRVIQVGWARIDMRGMPFNQTFTLPTSLTLRDTPDGCSYVCKSC